MLSEESRSNPSIALKDAEHCISSEVNEIIDLKNEKSARDGRSSVQLQLNRCELEIDAELKLR